MQVSSVPWLVEKAQDPLTCTGQVLEGKFSYSIVRHVVQQAVHYLKGSTSSHPDKSLAFLIQK